MPTFPVQVDKPVKYAFGIHQGKMYEKQGDLPEGGTHFYEFEEINEMPVLRYAYAQAYFRELSNSITKEQIIAHLDAAEKILNSSTINMVSLVKVLTQMRERTELIFEPEAFYKLCSIIFFTEAENPYSYSSKMAFDKIKMFKECEQTAFFLSVPIKRLLPFTNMSDEDLNSYLQAHTEVLKKEAQNLISWASSKT